MKPSQRLIEEIDHLQQHLAHLKSLLLDEETSNADGGIKPHLLSPAEREKLIEEISSNWAGPDAVEEIRQQREKGYA